MDLTSVYLRLEGLYLLPLSEESTATSKLPLQPPLEKKKKKCGQHTIKEVIIRNTTELCQSYYDLFIHTEASRAPHSLDARSKALAFLPTTCPMPPATGTHLVPAQCLLICNSLSLAGEQMRVLFCCCQQGDCPVKENIDLCRQLLIPWEKRSLFLYPFPNLQFLISSEKLQPTDVPSSSSKKMDAILVSSNVATW